MRAITVTIEPEGGFHSANDALAKNTEIKRIAIHHIQLLDDGTVVLLYELQGDLEQARVILENDEHVLSFKISGSQTGVAYIHAEPKKVMQKLLTIINKFEVALKKPFVHTLDGALKLTFIGENEVLKCFFDNIPDRVYVSIERVEEYSSTSVLGTGLLTERQREIAEYAFESGYYQTPRNITQREIAQDLGVSPGTIGEHLRKIENRILQEYFQ